MEVLQFEPSSMSTLYKYIPIVDMLQINNHIIYKLQSGAQLDDELFIKFMLEFEAISLGDTSNIDAIKTNEYLGTIGTDNEMQYKNKENLWVL